MKWIQQEICYDAAPAAAAAKAGYRITPNDYLY
jgi:hypothetical protein